jgi:hypothetical protein
VGCSRSEARQYIGLGDYASRARVRVAYTVGESTRERERERESDADSGGGGCKHTSNCAHKWQGARLSRSAYYRAVAAQQVDRCQLMRY